MKACATKDRIKWWNVVPGDQVRILADKSSPVREVLGVNKVTNRVYLKSDKKVRFSFSRAVGSGHDMNHTYSPGRLCAGRI